MYEQQINEFTIIVEEANDKPNQAWDRVQILVKERNLATYDVTVSPAVAGKGLKRYQVPNRHGTKITNVP
ncbi:MAG: hypothetical protein UR39_C0002G0115 [Candidatus Woesebacteria bacterium GW2011_GWA1_33_30]|uniref:Uncharacterized protein n=1 Tax=Candidatus Woesebacteria bacterium GW2011_GWA2_33_28 TaxID=1618561 RepID=A0A0G0CX77_9BACT|nr:MAG: hypothetical protein UR38_C0002G0115 [Candidatus Woesebacteria bacterium GW2011_GWA2_33_28]KKP48825.1 MAG: hypothetical protein UR39_C0002G0115 [Candidatus Woesebacteria bacterium GW2011_GWA1_33_30]KKP50098.1 MAG: hypothetical protein UR40_C0002G0115 [Microgenomates group bacterium GW2011_GWC1_33_32]KKP51869.1 MAG: hypothetical protein UR44_C0006G0115 [Candidatus Woesebacteria bacterium GW2011_GWB1_33_38]